MNRSRFLAVLLSALLLLGAVPGGFTQPATAAGGSCSFPVTKTDATGTQITIDSEPTRIVTLAPSAAQTMWEIGGKHKVVAVSTNAGYLSGTSSLPKISTYPSVDVEAVVNQTPDLVLAPDVISDDSVEKLRESGITVYNAPESTTIEDVYSKTLVIGRLTGECGGAESTVAWMREEIGEAKQAVRDRESPSVFYHLGGGWTAGGDTFIHELLTTAGAANVADEAGISGYQVMSSEQIVDRNPSWIIRGDNAYAAVPKDQLPYSATTAVAKDQIIVVDSNYINQAAPRIVFVIETIVEGLHPDVEIDVDSGGVNADLTTRQPTVSRSRTGDGTITHQVEDLYEGTTVDLEFGETTVGSTSGIGLTAVNLTLAKPNPSFAITLTPDATMPETAPGSAETVVIGSFDLTGNGLLSEDVAEATFRFTVPRDTLAVTGAGPDDVRLYRYHDGQWSTLETTLTGQDPEAFQFLASSPGTSIFAIGIPQRSVAIRNASIEGTDYTVGDSIRASASVRNPGITEISVPVALSVGGEVLTSREVTVPANSSVTIHIESSLQTPGTHDVSLGSRSLGEITVTAPLSSRSERSAVPETTAATATVTPAVTTDRAAQPSTDTLIHERGQDGFGIGIALLVLLLTVVHATRSKGEDR